VATRARGSARRTAPAPPTFVEFACEDPAGTRKFLTSVFAWKFRTVSMPGGQYLSFRTREGGQGGVRPTRPTESPSSLSYVRVADLDAALRKVQKAGGRVVLPRVDVPGMGSFFWFQIPGGPVLACWQDTPGRSPGR
jgi:uncharacterized protein